jgi:hypothetical protein
MQCSPFSRHLIPLRSKYPPQHPVLKHPQSMFLLWPLVQLNAYKSLVWNAERKIRLGRGRCGFKILLQFNMVINLWVG